MQALATMALLAAMTWNCAVIVGVTAMGWRGPVPFWGFVCGTLTIAAALAYLSRSAPEVPEAMRESMRLNVGKPLLGPVEPPSRNGHSKRTYNRTWPQTARRR